MHNKPDSEPFPLQKLEHKCSVQEAMDRMRRLRNEYKQFRDEIDKTWRSLDAQIVIESPEYQMHSNVFGVVTIGTRISREPLTGIAG